MTNSSARGKRASERTSTQLSESVGTQDGWPRKVKLGRTTVTIYKRTRANGSPGYEVAHYVSGRRTLVSRRDEQSAMDTARRLAKKANEGQVIAAGMTNREASEYATAVQKLGERGLDLLSVVNTVTECMNHVASLPDLLTAVRDHGARHRTVTRKRVADVVAELLLIKEARGASDRYLADLRYRLGRVSEAFVMDCCDVSTPQVQAWLDGQKLAAQSYLNFRRVISLLFKFAVSRGYASENPVAGVERVKVRASDVAIYTPGELRRLLNAATADFLPCLVLGAFAGLRSAEVERLRWEDVDLTRRIITVGAKAAKTASRRIVPVCDALAAWLAPSAGYTGPIWPGTHRGFYDMQEAVAPVAKVRWKKNGLRHSYASYRFALLMDAGRVAGEMGNSPQIVHRHYRELASEADGRAWFAIMPSSSAENAVSQATAATT